jgi:hypothetical protein
LIGSFVLSWRSVITIMVWLCYVPYHSVIDASSVEMGTSPGLRHLVLHHPRACCWWSTGYVAVQETAKRNPVHFLFGPVLMLQQSKITRVLVPPVWIIYASNSWFRLMQSNALCRLHNLDCHNLD